MFLSSLLDVIALQGVGFGKLALYATVMFFSLRFVGGLITKTPITQKAPQAVITDMLHWLFAPVARMVSRLVVAAVVLVATLLLDQQIGPDLFAGFGPAARQPLAVMFVELLVIQDLTSYWTHRLLHRSPWLWRVHAIHHSATDVGWSTTGRIHPVNEVVNYAAGVLPCLLLGFPLSAALMTIPAMSINAIAAHADWDPPLGRLYRVIAGPRFHRWHHTLQHEGGDKNFGNVFSIWDRMFGTYYLPAGRRPTAFGLDDGAVPGNWFGQLAYPFRSSKATVTAGVQQPAQTTRTPASPASPSGA